MGTYLAFLIVRSSRKCLSLRRAPQGLRAAEADHLQRPHPGQHPYGQPSGRPPALRAPDPIPGPLLPTDVPYPASNHVAHPVP